MLCCAVQSSLIHSFQSLAHYTLSLTHTYYTGRVPDGTKSVHANYTKLEVDIGGCRLSRVPHGLGTYRSLDHRQSVIYEVDHNTGKGKFMLYHGMWECGLKNGNGIEIDDSGIYSGLFLDGYRTGKGRFDYADGTTISGDFRKFENYPETTSSPVFTNHAVRNPYVCGEPSSSVNDVPVEILFGDGGYYKG